jgi:hypothetical protein
MVSVCFSGSEQISFNFFPPASRSEVPPYLEGIMNGNYYYFLINKIDFPFVFFCGCRKKNLCAHMGYAIHQSFHDQHWLYYFSWSIIEGIQKINVRHKTVLVLTHNIYVLLVIYKLAYFVTSSGFLFYMNLQATYVLFRDDAVLKLPYCIAIAGFVCALFAFGIPYLSALRIWLGFSTVFGLTYMVIAFVLSLRDGIIYSISFVHACHDFFTIY